MTNTTKVNNSTALRLYVLAHERAERNIGKDVFAFMNDLVKQALTAVEIIHIVNAQDEDMDAQKLRELLLNLSLLNAEQYGN
jgi:hypothetical protein